MAVSPAAKITYPYLVYSDPNPIPVMSPNPTVFITYSLTITEKSMLNKARLITNEL